MFVLSKFRLQFRRIYARLCNLIDLLLFCTNVLCDFRHPRFVCRLCFVCDLALHGLKEPNCLTARLVEFLQRFLRRLIALPDGLSYRRAARELRHRDVPRHRAKIRCNAVFFNDPRTAVCADIPAAAIGDNNVSIAENDRRITSLWRIAVARIMPRALCFRLINHVRNIAIIKGDARRCERIQNQLSAVC